MTLLVFFLHHVLKIISRFKFSTPNKKGVYSPLIVNISSGIGDALMAEPLIRTLRAAWPEVVIDVIAGASTSLLFEKHPDVRCVYVLKPQWLDWLRLARRLCIKKYCLYVGTIPSNTLSQLLLPWLAGIPFCIKHKTPHTGSRDFDFLFQRLEPIPDGRHRLECNLDLLKHIGINAVNIKPEIIIASETDKKVNNLLQKKEFDKKKLTVGFHPGCNPQAAFKRWAPENYAKLIRYLQEQWHAQIILVGGKDEEEDVEKIESLLTRKPFNFVGKADLHETAALIKHCRFFVSNDSGIMHLATAVDVPVFAIFGPKDERHIGPYGVKHTVMRNGKEVNNVSVEQVVDTLLQSNYGLKGMSPL